jgi:hypothetical protein
MALMSLARPRLFLLALGFVRFRLPEFRALFLSRFDCGVAGLRLAGLTEIDDLAHQVNVAKAAAS